MNPMSPNLNRFFSGISNFVGISDIRTTLASGNIIAVDRVSDELLGVVMLLSVIGRHTYNQEVVDDYEALFDRVKLEYDTKPFPGFWHPEGFLISKMTYDGPNAKYFLDSNRDAAYMFAVYEEIKDERALGYLPRTVRKPGKVSPSKVSVPARGPKKK